MNGGRFATRFTLSVVGMLALAGLRPVPALAQSDHTHTAAAAQTTKPTNALVQVVRTATERFKNVAVAESEGYFLQFGCVSGSDAGAMGLHYVNFPLVLDGELDATSPEIILYEPTSDGGVSLVGADYLVLAEMWDATHDGPPQLMGQLFHHFDAPNRFGLPPFYTLHVWAWKDSPTGTFVNWHTNLSCNAFTGQTP